MSRKCNSIYISVRHLSRVTRIDYDTGDIVMTTWHNKDRNERLLHHILSSVCILRILFIGRMMGVGLMVLVAEINTIFLRLRQLMRLAGRLLTTYIS